MASSPHALILPYPAQGHVIPLLELSHCLADRGFDIKFVNTDFNHDRVAAAMSGNGEMMTSRIRLVSIPDGLSPSEDRNNLGRLTQSILNTMPGCLHNLIRSTTTKFTCLITDHAMAWAVDVAKKASLRSAVFFPASAGVHATTMSIPKLVQDGIFDEEGLLLTKEMIQLSPGMPHLANDHFIWNYTGDDETRRILFNLTIIVARAAATADFLICNSFYEIEQPVFAYAPNILPIGPLLSGHGFGGHFWPEDTTCTEWLDEQPVNSVVYVAFGSFTVMGQHQFQELALGLELTGKPFLWVVRPDLITDGASNVNVYPHGFHERVASRGKMVGWSPQQRVLAHRAIACFVSHCGWNSTMEGVTNGVPFLCWPYFADQLFNQSYICDAWKTGVRLTCDQETGFISKEEIKSKVEVVINDEQMKERVLALKEKASRSIEKGGSSFENFNCFVEAIKM